MRSRVQGNTVLLGLLLAAACGGPTPAATLAPTATPAPTEATSKTSPREGGAPVAAAGARPPTRTPSGKFLRYLSIAPKKLYPCLAVDEAAAKAWANDPQNQKQLRAPFRHILVRVRAPEAETEARKKVDALLARLKAGEPFASVAKATEDPGKYPMPGEETDNFVGAVKDAYDALPPGGVSQAPVRSDFGWHIIAKDAVDEETRIASYKRAMARKPALALAEEFAAVLPSLGNESFVAARSRIFTKVLGNDSCTGAGGPALFRIRSDINTSSLQTWCDKLPELARGSQVEVRPDESVRVAVLTDDTLDQNETRGGSCVKN